MTPTTDDRGEKGTGRPRGVVPVPGTLEWTEEANRQWRRQQCPRQFQCEAQTGRLLPTGRRALTRGPGGLAPVGTDRVQAGRQKACFDPGTMGALPSCRNLLGFLSDICADDGGDDGDDGRQLSGLFVCLSIQCLDQIISSFHARPTSYSPETKNRGFLSAGAHDPNSSHSVILQGMDFHFPRIDIPFGREELGNWQRRVLQVHFSRAPDGPVWTVCR